MVNGVVYSLRKAHHCHFVRLIGAWLREPDIHLNKTWDKLKYERKQVKKRTHTFTSVASNLELLHQLADGFATGADDAGVGPRVQVDVLAHHLLQFGHQLLDSLTRLLHITLVPRDHDQILGGEGENGGEFTRGLEIRKKKKINFTLNACDDVHHRR